MAKKKAKAPKKAKKAAPAATGRESSDRKLHQILSELHGIRAELKRLHNMLRVVAPSTKTPEDVS